MRFDVERILYSTCSVNDAENESVVAHALKHCDGRFEVRKVFEHWPHRGEGAHYAFRDRVLRVPLENERNLHGFFVACFERTRKSKRPQTRKLTNVAVSDGEPPKKRRK